MSFKLLIISTLYPEYLKTYYSKNFLIKNKAYNEQYEHLLADTSELVGPYTNIFNKLGIKASCIITNANFLQEKWRNENGIKSKDNKRLVYEQVKMFKPEVLWLENLRYINEGWVDFIRNSVSAIRLIIASHCAPYNSQILRILKNLDFVLTCTPGFKSDLEKHGIKAFLVYHGFDPAILDKIYETDHFPENSFIFSGSLRMGGGYHNKRIGLIEDILKANIDLRIYGNLEKKYKIKAKQSFYHTVKLLNFLRLGKYIQNVPLLNKYIDYGATPVTNYSKRLVQAVNPPIFGVDMYKLLRKSKIILNTHGEAANEYAGNMRLFEATGVGSCLITDNKRNLNELFDLDHEVIAYDRSEDCIEKVKWLLENEEERRKIAKSGQLRTLKSHTIEDRCKLIIDIICRELKN
ncbi:hypothetical protein ES705_38962 [subsurface metagenome]